MKRETKLKRNQSNPEEISFNLTSDDEESSKQKLSFNKEEDDDCSSEEPEDFLVELEKENMKLE